MRKYNISQATYYRNKSKVKNGISLNLSQLSNIPKDEISDDKISENS